MFTKEDVLKITKSVYQVLDFLPEGDPLKNKAKEKALAILENCTAISVGLGTEKVREDIGILLDYLAIAKHQSWISATNFFIFEKEYQQLKVKMAVYKKEIVAPKEVEAGSRHIIVPRTKTGFLGVRQRPESDQLSEKARVRQAKILAMLKRQPKAQVSDFIKQLPDITKRTIRRDLDDLLKKGKVVRIGAWNQVFYQIT